MDLANTVMSRRGFIVLASLAAMSSVVPLGGCAQQTPGESPEPLISVSAALGPDFETVKAAIAEEATDAVLLAARTSTVLRPDSTCSWSYLFGSESEDAAYTAFTDSGQAFPAYYGAFSAKSWSNIPRAEDIEVDADRAFALVCDDLGEGTAVENCYVYLLTYVSESNDPEEGAMKWYVEINAVTDREGALDTSRDEQSASGGDPEIMYAVDARNGTVERLV